MKRKLLKVLSGILLIVGVLLLIQVVTFFKAGGYSWIGVLLMSTLCFVGRYFIVKKINNTATSSTLKKRKMPSGAFAVSFLFGLALTFLIGFSICEVTWKDTLYNEVAESCGYPFQFFGHQDHVGMTFFKMKFFFINFGIYFLSILVIYLLAFILINGRLKQPGESKTFSSID